MPSDIDIADQQQLLGTHRRTLQFLLNQLAMHTYLYATPGLLHNIDDARRNIGTIKQTLRGWDIEVEDLPIDDEEHGQPSQPEAPAMSPGATDEDSYQAPLLLGVMVDVSQPMVATLKKLPKKSGLSSRA